MRKRWIFFFSVLAFLIVVASTIAILIRTGWLPERLRTYSIDRLEELTGWDFEIAALRGNFIAGVIVEDVTISRPEASEPLLRAREIVFNYDILDLILGSKDMKLITIKAPFFNAAGDWSLAEEEAAPGDGESSIPNFSVKGLKVEAGTVVGIPRLERLDSVDLHLSVSAQENRVDFTLVRCRLDVKDVTVQTVVCHGLFEKELLRLRKFQLATESSRVDAKGVIGAEAVHLDGETDLDLEELSRLFSLPFLSGMLRSSFNARIAEDSRSLAGTLSLNRGKIERYDIGNLEGRFSSDLSTVVVDVEKWSIGNGESAGLIEFDLKTTGAAAKVSGVNLDLSQISEELKELASDIQFEATVDFASTAPVLQGSVDVQLDGSTIRRFRTDELSSKVNFEKEFVEIESLHSRWGNSSITASGKIFESAIDLKVETRGIELSQFSDILEREDLSGELFADMLIQGDPRRPFIIGSFWAKDLQLPHTTFAYLNGHLSYQYSETEPRIDLNVVTPEGTAFNRNISALTLDVAGEGDVFRYSANFGLETSSVELEGEIRTSDGETRVVNHRLLFSSEGHSITTDGDLVLVITPETRLEKTRFPVYGGWFELAGNYTPPDLIEATVVAEEIDLGKVAELARMKQVLRGTLGLNLQLRGPFLHPEFDLEGSIDNFNYEYANLKRVDMELSYANDDLRLTKLDLKGDRGAYSITGHLPVDLSLNKPALVDEEMQLSVDLAGLEPWMFQSAHPYVELKECEFGGNLRIHGTPMDPKIAGSVTLRDGQFYSRFLKIFITELRTDLTFEDKTMTVGSLSARTEEGRINARGTLSLEKLIPETIDMEVEMAELPVRGLEDIYALIDGDLTISGEVKKPSIEGTVAIDELLITTPFKQASGPRGERKPLEFYCNLSVEANRSIWVRNQNANIQLDGELNVKVKEGLLVLSGELNTVRGWVNYYETEFEIVRGRFKFTDIPEINPDLDILAEREVTYTSVENDVRSSKRDIIRLEIRGPMRAPEVVLSSESGELSELDIFSLLTLNMTWDELGSEERMDILREQAAGRVVDLAASQVTREIRRAMGLDALRIKVKPLGEEAGAKLTVGKYISRDLYVSYVTELFSTAKDQFTVEYFVGKGGSIVGERDEEGRYFIGLNYRLRY